MRKIILPHTPGKWTASGGAVWAQKPTPSRSFFDRPEDELVVGAIYGDARHIQDERTLANTALVAASPDLFELAQYVLADGKASPKVMKLARSAIRKATHTDEPLRQIGSE